MEIFLPLSNLAMIPTIYATISRRLYAESLILSVCMLTSILYHTCESFHYCFRFPGEILMFGDFLFAELSMLTVLAAISLLEESAKLTLIICYYTLSVIMVLGIRNTEIYAFEIGFTIYLLRLIRLSIIHLSRGRTINDFLGTYFGNVQEDDSLPLNSLPERAKGYHLCPYLIGAGLSVGAVVADYFQNPSNYFWLHSLWHVLIMSSGYFLIRSVR